MHGKRKSRPLAPDGTLGPASDGYGRDLYLMRRFGKSPHSLRGVASSSKLTPLVIAPPELSVLPAASPGCSSSTGFHSPNPRSLMPMSAGIPPMPMSLPAGAMRQSYESTPLPAGAKTCCGVGGGFPSSVAASPDACLGASQSSAALTAATPAGTPGGVTPGASPAPRQKHFAGLNAKPPPPRRVPKPRPTRLEVIDGLAERSFLTSKAKGALLLTETLSRGSLQRRDIGPKMEYALLDPPRSPSISLDLP